MSLFSMLSDVGSCMLESIKCSSGVKMKLERIFTCDTYTIGKLYVNGTYVCDTIEDTDRGLSDNMSESEISRKKVYGQTAIPTGKYDINMNTVSPKFKDRSWAKPFGGILPRFVNVKGFEGVLIHVGNKAQDSLGCILVGTNNVKGQVSNSTAAFNKLMNNYLMPAKEKGEKITIEIVSKY